MGAKASFKTKLQDDSVGRGKTDNAGERWQMKGRCVLVGRRALDSVQRGKGLGHSVSVVTGKTTKYLVVNS